MAKKKITEIIYSWKVAPYVFTLPFILSFVVFWIYPLLSAVNMSFQDILPGQTAYVGFANFAKLLKDKTFFIAIGNSFLYTFLILVLLIPFPLLFAVLIDSNFVKTKGLFKAILYLPSLTSVVVSGIIFGLLFAEMPTSGVNQFIALFGFKPVTWLRLKGGAYFVLLLVACWKWTGVNILYFLAGLKAIDSGLYESAEIDGASSAQKFFHITVPLLKPVSIYVITISTYSGLAMFLDVLMILGSPTASNNIALTIVGYLYQRGIVRNQLGYGNAVGVVLLVIALVVNITQLNLTGTIKERKE